MHSYQLFFLALYSDPTRKIESLLAHEIQALSDPLRGIAQVRLCGLALISWTPDFSAIMREEVLYGTKEEI